MPDSTPETITTRQLMALYQMCKVLREAASYNKLRHEHAVTQSIWSQFCKQLSIVEHTVEQTNVET